MDIGAKEQGIRSVPEWLSDWKRGAQASSCWIFEAGWRQQYHPSKEAMETAERVGHILANWQPKVDEFVVTTNAWGKGGVVLIVRPRGSERALSFHIDASGQKIMVEFEEDGQLIALVGIDGEDRICYHQDMAMLAESVARVYGGFCRFTMHAGNKPRQKAKKECAPKKQRKTR